MALRRLLLTALLAVLTGTLMVVVGLPDPGRALDGFTGSGSSRATASAVIGLLCWSVITVIIVAVGTDVVRSAWPERRAFVGRWWRVALVTAGVALLVAGIAHRQDAYRVCCADPGTVQQAEHLAR